MILPTLLYVLLSADPEREREVRAAITAHEEALERLRAEEKRLALAREVHDGIGAHLTAAAVQAEVATDTQTDEPLRAQAALARLRKRIAQAIEELSLLTTQRPQTTWGALIDELRVVTEGIAQPVAWTFDASCVHPESVVSPEAHLALRRALQEGVANAVRHGKPRRISIRIRVAEEQAEIRVEDDGVGLSGSTAGFGRRSIAARMESVGGLAEWQPGSVGGTALHLSLPIRATSSQVAA
jgi:signal transduction histidine kinase